MAVLTYNIDSDSALNFSSPNLENYFIFLLFKRLSISLTNALINSNMVDPENAYTE